MRHPWLFICFMLLIRAVSSAQQPLPYRVFTTQNGLVNNVVYWITHDEQGYLWIATDGGISRFDGRNFKNYTVVDGLLANEVFGVFVDKKNKIWATTFKGVVCLDSTKQQFVGNDTIRNIPYNMFWVDGKSKKTYFSTDQKRNELCELKLDGSIKLVSSDVHFIQNCISTETFILKNKTVLKYNSNEKVEKVGELSVKPYRYQGELIKIDSFIFFRTFNNSIAKLGINNTPIDTFLTPKNIGNATIYNIQYLPFMKIPRLWISTSDGVYIFNAQTKEYLFKINFDCEVHSVFYDREGNYWFTTKGCGIYHYTNLDIKYWGKSEGLKRPHINALCKTSDKAIIAAASNFNLSLIDPNGQLRATVVLGENGNRVRKLEMVNNDLYILRENNFTILRDFVAICRKKENVKLSDFNPVYINNSDYKTELNPNQSIIQVWHNSKNFAMSKNQKYLFRTKQGYLPNSNVIVKTSIKSGKTDSIGSINNSKIYAISEASDDHLWFGGINGLNVFAPLSKKSDSVPYDYSANISDIFHLPNDYHLIATNGNGLILFKEKKAVKQWTNKDILSTNTCKKIVASKDFKKIYIATDAGIVVMNFADTNHFETPQYIQILGKQYSLPTLEINDIQLDTTNDILTIATAQGIASFNPTQLNEYTLPPKLLITGITRKNTPLSIFQHTKLPYDNRDIQFIFSAIAFQNAAKIIYDYKLKRNDILIIQSDASNADKNNDHLDFSLYADGNYQLLVRCKREGLNEKWSDYQVIRFEISPPYWRNPYALFLYFLLSGVGLWCMSYWWKKEAKKKVDKENQLEKERIKQENERERERLDLEYRALMSQMNPHFMFNTLNSVQRYFLSNKKEDMLKGIDFLDNFGELMNLTLTNTQKENITLADEIVFLKTYMSFLSNMTADTNRAFTFSFNGDNISIDTQNVLIPPMLIQPLLENAYKYGLIPRSKSNFIQLTVANDALFFVITIEDNGFGLIEQDMNEALSPTKTNRKHAVEIIKRRLALMNTKNGQTGKLEFINKQQLNPQLSGTIVHIFIPIQFK